jgi:hypothetical protein
MPAALSVGRPSPAMVQAEDAAHEFADALERLRIWSSAGG